MSHYVLDDGKLVVAHAGHEGRDAGPRIGQSARLRSVRRNDRRDRRVRPAGAVQLGGGISRPGDGRLRPHAGAAIPNGSIDTVNIDTGCVFGGKLTALRYPEKEFVSVPAKHTYCEPARPFLPAEQQAPALSAQQLHDDVLDADDVLGKRIISTRLHHNVTIREENATAALEVMSRFAANPKWLIYLPPTMSPCETTNEPGLLEHPAEAFAYFRNQGVPQVVCEEKHMGSRAVVVICRDEEAARERFGIADDEIGNRLHPHRPAILQRRRTRTAISGATSHGADGRRLLGRVQHDLGLPRLRTDAVVGQGAGAAAFAVRRRRRGRAMPRCRKSWQCLEQAAQRLNGEAQSNLTALQSQFLGQRTRASSEFVAAYRQYCWPVDSLDDLEARSVPSAGDRRQASTPTSEPRLAHGNAGEDLRARSAAAAGDAVQSGRCHRARRANKTGIRLVGSSDRPRRRRDGRQAAGLRRRGKKGLVQPAVKCRGREYLRIIYGPDYDADGTSVRLRNRGLAAKRSLALREFALGIEALERFVRKEPLRRVHECVFGVLALESEPVDPRL